MISPRSLNEVNTAIMAGEYSLTELVSHYLDNIHHSDLNAFNEVYAEEALEKAAIIQQKIDNGTAGKLAGMVIGLKDNIAHKGHIVSASSKILEHYQSVFSATVTERMLNEDAIIIGRLNCDEFAMGSSNENSAFGPVKNPHHPEYVPGGSSGGSAAAVAANLCLAALGTDTGGSIRQPASYCGVVGLKPTYGRVSRYGLIAYASSFDQIGPLTHTIEDAALLLEVIAGPDDYDSTTDPRPVPALANLPATDKKMRIGYLRECIDSEGMDPEVKAAFEQFKEKLIADGHEVVPVSFPYLKHLIPTYYVLTTAEASSNLARFDGIHYGYRSPHAQGIDNTYYESRSEGFGPEVKRRIMLGTFVLSSGFYDAYYTRAQKVRRVIKNETKKLLQETDFLLIPTTPTPAFKIGEITEDPITMYLQDIFTVQANLAGVPAISLPLAQTKSGMPIGFQLLADHFEETKLLAFSAEIMNKK